MRADSTHVESMNSDIRQGLKKRQPPRVHLEAGPLQLLIGVKQVLSCSWAVLLKPASSYVAWLAIVSGYARALDG